MTVENRKKYRGISRLGYFYRVVGCFPVVIGLHVLLVAGASVAIVRTGAVAALFYSALFVYLARKRSDACYFDWAILWYLAGTVVALYGAPAHAAAVLPRYYIAGMYAALFAAAFLPPFFRREPFTCYYARKRTPPAIWRHPLFLRVNLIMTGVWAVMLAAAVVISLHPSLVMQAVVPVVIFVGAGIPFNRLFPDYYMKRRGAGTHAEAHDEKDASLHIDALKDPGDGTTVTGDVQKEQRNGSHHFVKEEQRMKVLVVNSSARTENYSKTALMAQALVDGMRGAGADVEVIHLRSKTVKNCIGCFSCWTKTPGVCVHNDDMTTEIFPKWREADIVVYASPLYHFTVNGMMKTFIERTLPFLEPYLVEKEGKTVHPHRFTHPKVVMLSVAGFPEMAVFDQLSSWARFIFGGSGKLIAEIYRPDSETLTVSYAKVQAKEVFAATADAGREIIEKGAVAEETMNRVTQPLMEDARVHHRLANLMWNTCIAEGVTPQEMALKNIMPRPETVEDLMMIMPLGFNPHTAGNLTAVIQFIFTGNGSDGACCLHIENGAVTAQTGRVEPSTVTITTPFDAWVDIMTGKMDGQRAFMDGIYAVTGDITLLMRMKDLFSSQ